MSVMEGIFAPCGGQNLRIVIGLERVIKITIPGDIGHRWAFGSRLLYAWG
jgi:hypothetical protein